MGLIGAKTPFINSKLHTLLYNDQVFENGSVGFASEYCAKFDVNGQDLLPIGDPMTITKCRGNIILEVRSN
jgi:small ligand-binding sensory domain FIST